MSNENLWEDEEETEEQSEDDVIDVEGKVKDSGEESLPTHGSQNTLVRPVENVDEVVEVYDQFEEIKSKLLDMDTDVQKIGSNNHITKSGWRKIATAFNLSVETKDVEKTVEDGIVTFTVQAEAIAPNGKSTVGTGLCASNESNHMDSNDIPTNPEEHDDYLKVDGKWRRLKDPKEVQEHDIMATAETRAKNRAISDLVGGGEVSAEEMGRKKKEEILGDS